MIDRWTAFENMAATLPIMQLSYSVEALDQVACGFLRSHKRRRATFFTHALVLFKIPNTLCFV